MLLEASTMSCVLVAARSAQNASQESPGSLLSLSTVCFLTSPNEATVPLPQRHKKQAMIQKYSSLHRKESLGSVSPM